MPQSEEQVPLTDARLTEIRQRVEYFKARKERAVERLALISDKNWYFALLGLKTDVERFDFTGLAVLQKVIEPPGEVELASALQNKAIFSAIGRYSHSIRYELAAHRDELSTDQAVFNSSWWIISALRVRTLAEILIPAVADYSWSTIAAAPDGACHAQLIEDVPLARACYGLWARRVNKRCASTRANATKCQPASVSGQRS